MQYILEDYVNPRYLFTKYFFFNIKLTLIKFALIYPGSHSSIGINLTRECSSK
jgi:hypothetical protein